VTVLNSDSAFNLVIYYSHFYFLLFIDGFLFHFLNVFNDSRLLYELYHARFAFGPRVSLRTIIYFSLIFYRWHHILTHRAQFRSFSPPSHVTVGDNTMIVTLICIPLDYAIHVPFYFENM